MKEVRKIYSWCLEKKYNLFMPYHSVSASQIGMLHVAADLSSPICNKYFFLSTGNRWEQQTAALSATVKHGSVFPQIDCLPTAREETAS